jgi:predicted metal-dependent peptidase
VTEEVLAEAAAWVRAGRVLAIETCPYLDVALTAMIPVPVVGLGTVATDARWRFYYDPARLMSFPEARRRRVLVADWLHEVGHQLRDHAARWQLLGAPPQLHPVYNTAGDALINADLADLDVMLLATDVTFASLPDDVNRTMTTEQIYQRLLSEMPTSGSRAGLVGGGSRGGGSARPSDCGSGAGGPRRDWELPIGDADPNAAQDGDPGVPDPGPGAGPGLSDGSVDADRAELIRQETATQILSHAKARGIGSVPHRLRKWADGYLSPATDWRQELRSAVSRSLGQAAGRFDYSWVRPPRRRIPGYTTPGMAAPEPPTVAVVVDTSGSMSADDLAQAIADITALARAAGGASRTPPVRVIPCDTRPGPVQGVRRGADIAGLQLTGGGGTDMAAGIHRAAELSPRPRVLVVITDGDTPWPQHAPDTLTGGRHIAVVVAGEADQALDRVPDWMHLIRAERAEFGGRRW